MNNLFNLLQRESIYIWYYFDLQLRQIIWYWILGMAIGSGISTFAKDKIHGLFVQMQGKTPGLLGIIPACLLGIASPLCMYGTIPIAASFRKQGMREDWLAAFMMASILLSALFQRYVPENVMVRIFGANEAWGVLMAATIGVPLYACGGGTIPLLQSWLTDGMSLGSAAAFMITGPATKITNLGALKIAMGWRRFSLYGAFVMVYAFICGIVVNMI